MIDDDDDDDDKYGAIGGVRIGRGNKKVLGENLPQSTLFTTNPT
jgi:hypothetical protein